MKIEKLTENKIRIILKIEELSDNNINIDDFLKDNLKSQKFFLDILNKAEKELGFYTKDCRLLIEAFSSLDEVCVFTITKYTPKSKKSCLKLKRNNNKKYSLNTVFKFDSFDDFCALCKYLNNSNVSTQNIAQKISLYFFKNTYYLVLLKINFTNKNIKKLLNMICEFSSIVKNELHIESKLLEFGKPIIKQNALKSGMKYF